MFALALLIGHGIGDFLLQNQWMAMNKSGNTWKCLVHCTLYTLAVVLMTWPFVHGIAWTLLVFASHFPIDRWSLADKWLRLIRGRNLGEFVKQGHKDIPLMPFGEEKNYWALRAAFAGVVYTVADNTMHLALMYAAALYLGVA